MLIICLNLQVFVKISLLRIFLTIDCISVEIDRVSCTSHLVNYIAQYHERRQLLLRKHLRSLSAVFKLWSAKSYANLTRSQANL